MEEKSMMEKLLTQRIKKTYPNIYPLNKPNFTWRKKNFW